MANQKFETMWNMVSANLYQFDHLVTEDLICIDCKKMMINAHQAPCGCKFCKQCIERYVELENSFCPGSKEECKEEILSKNSSISVDHRANNTISRLKTKCPHDGCRHECELKCMWDHLQVCEKNPLNIVIGIKNEPSVNDGDQKLVEMTNNLMNAVNSLREQEEKNRQEIDLLREMVEKQLSTRTDKAVEEKENHVAQEANNVDKGSHIGVIEDLKSKLDKRETEIRQVIKETSSVKKAYFEQFRNEMQIILDDKMTNFAQDMLSLYERQVRHLRREAKCQCDRAAVAAASVVALPLAAATTAMRLDKVFRFDKLVQCTRKGATLRSDEFLSLDKAYRMQLVLCADGDTAVKESHLSVELFMCKDGHAIGAQWPFKADVTMHVRHPADDGVVLMSTTKRCVLNRHDWSAMFNFRMRDLTEAAALKDDSIVIGCSI